MKRWTTKRSFGLLGASATLVVACATPTAAPEGRGSTRSHLDDVWQPPSSNATGSYEDIESDECAGDLKPGARELGDVVQSQFGSLEVGGYNCRDNTAQAGKLSMHAMGRAVDIMIGSDADKGRQIADWLVENATNLGVQFIIYNQTKWKVTESGGDAAPYGGPNPHTDHVHAELTIAASEALPNPVGVSASGANPTCPEGQACGPNPAVASTTEEGAECQTALDCDPSGSILCLDGGTCDWDCRLSPCGR